MWLQRVLRSKALYLGATLLTLAVLFAKARWEEEQVRSSLSPYIHERVAFKLSRPDNHLHYYIEDLVQIQVSPDAKELRIVRHTPSDDELRLPIEKAQIQAHQTVMLVTHRYGNLYRLYLQPESFMLLVNNVKTVLAMEAGTKLSPGQVELFRQDPLYPQAASHL